MKIRVFLLACMVLVCACQHAPPISFVKEDVTINVLDGRVRVTGDYFFENLTAVGKRVKFYYPFPIDSNHHFPDTILIAYPFERDSSGIYFSIFLRPDTIDSFTIMYEQRIENAICRYITTTTQMWNRPIKEATFTIVAPETLSINANYAFSETTNADVYRHYTILIEDFFPEDDLIITW